MAGSPVVARVHEHVEVPELPQVDVSIGDRRNRRSLVCDGTDILGGEEPQQLDEPAGEEQVSSRDVIVLLREDGAVAGGTPPSPAP